MSDFLQLVLNGLAMGSVYVLVGVGVTIVYGLTRLVNFAHGEQVTLGAFVCFATLAVGVPFFLAVVAGAAAAGAAGFAMERGGFRFTRSRPISGIILSIGLTLMLQAIFFMIWGDEVAAIGQPVPGRLEFAGVAIAYKRIIVAVVAGALVVALFIFLRHGRLGIAIRAYAQDPEASELAGIRPQVLVPTVFVIGGLLAGIAGGLLLSMVPVSRFIGTAFAIKGFLVAIVGGLGSPAGALVAGLLIGVVESLAGGYLGGGVAALFGLLTAIAVLMVRPGGIVRGEEGGRL